MMAIDPTAEVHPSAVIEPGAEIGPGCRIGPFALVGPEVRLGQGVTLKNHAVVTGWTEIGAGTVVFPFAVVGEVPQDLKYQGERTRLIVGARCRIREGATLNTGTAGGGGVTRVGDDCLFMTGAHVGHDAQLGSRVILANQAAIAGHCQIGDDVIVGGLSGVHQFVRVGRHAFIGGCSRVTQDVPPCVRAVGNPIKLFGLNSVGLQRSGFEESVVRELKKAYRFCFRSDLNLSQGVEKARAELELIPDVQHFLEFIEASQRGVGF